MAIPTIPVPAHYSADIAYKAMKKVDPWLRAAKDEINSSTPPLTVRKLYIMFTQISKYKANIQQLIADGSLDADLTWKNRAIDMDTSLDPLMTIKGQAQKKYSKRVAAVKIAMFLEKRNKKLIREYKLKPGAKVRWKYLNRIMEISSISDNGRLWFKGGNGWGAYPSQVEPVD